MTEPVNFHDLSSQYLGFSVKNMTTFGSGIDADFLRDIGVQGNQQDIIQQLFKAGILFKSDGMYYVSGNLDTLYKSEESLMDFQEKIKAILEQKRIVLPPHTNMNRLCDALKFSLKVKSRLSDDGYLSLEDIRELSKDFQRVKTGNKSALATTDINEKNFKALFIDKNNKDDKGIDVSGRGTIQESADMRHFYHSLQMQHTLQPDSGMSILDYARLMLSEKEGMEVQTVMTTDMRQEAKALLGLKGETVSLKVLKERLSKLFREKAEGEKDAAYHKSVDDWINSLLPNHLKKGKDDHIIRDDDMDLIIAALLEEYSRGHQTSIKFSNDFSIGTSQHVISCRDAVVKALYQHVQQLSHMLLKDLFASTKDQKEPLSKESLQELINKSSTYIKQRNIEKMSDQVYRWLLEKSRDTDGQTIANIANFAHMMLREVINTGTTPDVNLIRLAFNLKDKATWALSKEEWSSIVNKFKNKTDDVRTSLMLLAVTRPGQKLGPNVETHYNPILAHTVKKLADIEINSDLFKDYEMLQTLQKDMPDDVVDSIIELHEKGGTKAVSKDQVKATLARLARYGNVKALEFVCREWNTYSPEIKNSIKGMLGDINVPPGTRDKLKNTLIKLMKDDEKGLVSLLAYNLNSSQLKEIKGHLIGLSKNKNISEIRLFLDNLNSGYKKEVSEAAQGMLVSVGIEAWEGAMKTQMQEDGIAADKQDAARLEYIFDHIWPDIENTSTLHQTVALSFFSRLKLDVEKGKQNIITYINKEEGSSPTLAGKLGKLKTAINDETLPTSVRKSAAEFYWKLTYVHPNGNEVKQEPSLSDAKQLMMDIPWMALLIPDRIAAVYDNAGEVIKENDINISNKGLQLLGYEAVLSKQQTLEARTTYQAFKVRLGGLDIDAMITEHNSIYLQNVRMGQIPHESIAAMDKWLSTLSVPDQSVDIFLSIDSENPLINADTLIALDGLLIDIRNRVLSDEQMEKVGEKIGQIMPKVLEKDSKVSEGIKLLLRNRVMKLIDAGLLIPNDVADHLLGKKQGSGVPTETTDPPERVTSPPPPVQEASIDPTFPGYGIKTIEDLLLKLLNLSSKQADLNNKYEIDNTIKELLNTQDTRLTLRAIILKTLEQGFSKQSTARACVLAYELMSAIESDMGSEELNISNKSLEFDGITTVSQLKKTIADKWIRKDVTVNAWAKELTEDYRQWLSSKRNSDYKRQHIVNSELFKRDDRFVFELMKYRGRYTSTVTAQTYPDRIAVLQKNTGVDPDKKLGIFTLDKLLPELRLIGSKTS